MSKAAQYCRMSGFGAMKVTQAAYFLCKVTLAA